MAEFDLIDDKKRKGKRGSGKIEKAMASIGGGKNGDKVKKGGKNK